MSRRPVGLWLALALLTASCASVTTAERSFGGPDEQDAPRGPRSQLFISPSGQPFRAPAGQPYPAAAWFAAADADHDGRLTRDEFRADAEAWFRTIDADADGEVSMPEVTRWEETIVPEITRATFGGYGGGALRRNRLDTRAQGAAGYSVVNEPHPIRGADADFSMGVSRAEWRAAADRRFDLLDEDKDGALLLAGLPRTPTQGRAAR
ncbi:hypothetical protein [uncultured Phenylobacterium sp.]|uniref:hypothetical protein n=1 Tax=uncultured Phenylobacterium sp. TaxID=349273 RepID=UPI00260119F8|nr:hypothetical protein [uncultured Phenylobacterium sp.]